MSDTGSDSDHDQAHDSEFDDTELQHHDLKQAKPAIATHGADDVVPVSADSRVEVVNLVFKWAPGGPGGDPQDLELLRKLGIVSS